MLLAGASLAWRTGGSEPPGPPPYYEYDLSEFPPAAASILPGDIVRTPFRIRQVLPFMPSSGRYLYLALGGYPLRPDGQEDVRHPLLVVLPYEGYATRAKAGATWRVRGRAVLLRGTAEKAEGYLDPQLERDLAYIASRVNYWTRVTLWGLEVEG